MDKTYLIQRVSAPRLGGLGIANPFSFGGGGGRLSQEALELLAPVFSFEYMGAAEYEYGAVPEGLNKIFQLAKNENLAFSTMDVKLKSIKFDKYGYEDWTERQADTMPVYVIGSKTDMEEIRRRIHLLATDENRCLADMPRAKLHEGLYVRDAPFLNRQLKFEHKYDRPVLGWLELDNGFFFTIDKNMAEGFGKLFGIRTSIP